MAWQPRSNDRKTTSTNKAVIIASVLSDSIKFFQLSFTNITTTTTRIYNGQCCN
jgi:hypothetical protein